MKKSILKLAIIILGSFTLSVILTPTIIVHAPKTTQNVSNTFKSKHTTSETILKDTKVTLDENQSR